MAMAKEKFFKGPKLLSLARRKARQAGLGSDGLKLEDLICRIQQKEGYTVCFRKKTSCPERSCCWQVSCGARMLTA